MAAIEIVIRDPDGSGGGGSGGSGGSSGGSGRRSRYFGMSPEEAVEADRNRRLARDPGTGDYLDPLAAARQIKADEREQQRKDAEAEREAKSKARADTAKRVAGQVAGGAAGRYAGAAIGTMIAPGIGTAIGAALGGAVGGQLGGKAADASTAERDNKGSGTGVMGTVGRAVNFVGDTLERVLDPIGAVANDVTKGLKLAEKGFQVAGEAAQKVASNDGIGALTTVGRATADALGEIPVVGKAAAAGLNMVLTATNAVTDTMMAFNNRGRELARFDAGLAGAKADQDVSRLMMDIQEARRTSEGMTKLIEKQTQFEEFIREAVAPFKDLAIELLPKAIDFIMSALQTLIEIGYLIPGVSDDKVDQLVNRLEAIRKNTDRRPVAGDAMDAFFRFQIPVPAGAPAVPAFRAPLGVPAVAPPAI